MKFVRVLFIVLTFVSEQVSAMEIGLKAAYRDTFLPIGNGINDSSDRIRDDRSLYGGAFSLLLKNEQNKLELRYSSLLSDHKVSSDSYSSLLESYGLSYYFSFSDAKASKFYFFSRYELSTFTLESKSSGNKKKQSLSSIDIGGELEHYIVPQFISFSGEFGVKTFINRKDLTIDNISYRASEVHSAINPFVQISFSVYFE